MGERGNPRIVVIGGGFGGIATVIALQNSGFDQITILDRADELGGTWHYNDYPGAACDIPSFYYSFTYAKRKYWSRICSPRSEILNYIHEVAAEFGITKRFIGGVDVTSCQFDDATVEWTVTAADGKTWNADAVVIATGQLHQPQMANIPGSGNYKGHSFHSSNWDHDFDLKGKSVAVIGTGASSVQLVPEVAKLADKLVVFQRTGNWLLPRRNYPFPGWQRWAIRHIPGVNAYMRLFIYVICELTTLGIRHPHTWGRVWKAISSVFMRSQLRGDPELRRKIWPDYPWGCKRVLWSSHFLPALQRPNVELVTEPIEEMTESGIRTSDGNEYKVDAVIHGTGFRTQDFMFPLEVIGAKQTNLRDLWREGAHAHLGIVVPGFPSMFLVYGPNTNTSGGSIITYHEAQARYITQAMRHVRARAAKAIDVLEHVEAESAENTQRRFAGTAWVECNSWYRHENGRIVTTWPDYMRDYIRETRLLDPAEFRFIEA